MKEARAKRLFLEYQTKFRNHPLYYHGIRVMKNVINVREILDINKRDDIIIAAKYHDIGKITWSSKMLNKKFTEKEIKKIKSHIFYGKEILEIIFPNTDIPFLAYLHHERIDGSGYLGFKKEEIPLNLQISSQIIAVCDLYDALFRTYYKKTIEEAKQILKEKKGKVLDEIVVNAFLKII